MEARNEVVVETSSKRKRSRNNSSAKPARSPSGSRAKTGKYPQKLTVCLALFVFSLFSAGLLSLLLIAPANPAHDNLALQLHPRAQCPLIAQDPSAKIAVRESLQRDSWYFIPAYTLSFLALGLAVFSSRQPVWIYGLGIILLSIFAAGSDLLENHYLESCIDGNFLAAGLARGWALSKWECLSLALVAAAPPFLARNDWTQKIGYVLASTGILSVLLLIPLDFAYSLVRYALVPLLGLGLGLILVTFVRDLLNPDSQRAHWQ